MLREPDPVDGGAGYFPNLDPTPKPSGLAYVEPPLPPAKLPKALPSPVGTLVPLRWHDVSHGHPRVWVRCDAARGGCGRELTLVARHMEFGRGHCGCLRGARVRDAGGVTVQAVMRWSAT